MMQATAIDGRAQMKAVVYDGPREFTVREVADPEPGPGEVVLRERITGVCGTDLHIHDGGFFSAYPLIPGHEIVGEVVAIGAGVDGALLGRVVAADNTDLCGYCYHCQRDEPLFCKNFRSLGVNAPGGFAESVLVHAAKCFPVDHLVPEVAVMTEPTACAVHGMDVLSLRPGSDVLVFGAGPTGLVLAQLILHGGAARVVVAAPTPFKLDLARSYGIDETVLVNRANPDQAIDSLRGLAPQGFDVVVDATGATAIVERCLPLTKTGGTFLTYGMADEEARVPFSPYEVFRRELTIKGSFAQTHCFDRAIAYLRSGRVHTEGIVTHTFPLDRYGDALVALRSRSDCLKAVIVP
jgi:D-arabinitol dehydrogenase (NADP+)